MTSIGFIGLGNMGAHMARNLIKQGHKLVVYDSVASNMESLKSSGATVAGSPAEVAEGTKQIVTMLPSSPNVRDVYAGEKGILRTIQEGTICMDSSTIDPSVSQEMYSEAQKKSAAYLDAPVSGGVIAAEAAGLTFMVGGDKPVFDAAEPILKLMGKNVVHTGAVGTGQAAKLCNNMLLAISMIGTSEAMNLGQKLGLDPKMLASILNTSSGRCWSSEIYNPVPGVLENTPSTRGYVGGFGTALMCKDLGLAQNAATVTQSPTPLGSLAHQFYRLMTENPEYADKDFSVVYQLLKGKKQ